MTNKPFRCFGVVPAAGKSSRMGADKLRLPIGEKTLIEQVLRQWSLSGVAATIVVLGNHDPYLESCCQSLGAISLVLEPAPQEMKHSVQGALNFIDDRFSPEPSDAWLLAPADIPGLDTRVIERVMGSYDPRSPGIVVPMYRGHRGHPTLFPWTVSPHVFRLADGHGVNALLDQLPWQSCELDDPAILSDLDTPEDYRRI